MSTLLFSMSDPGLFIMEIEEHERAAIHRHAVQQAYHNEERILKRELDIALENEKRELEKMEKKTVGEQAAYEQQVRSRLVRRQPDRGSSNGSSNGLGGPGFRSGQIPSPSPSLGPSLSQSPSPSYSPSLSQSPGPSYSQGQRSEDEEEDIR